MSNKLTIVHAISELRNVQPKFRRKLLEEMHCNKNSRLKIFESLTIALYFVLFAGYSTEWNSIRHKKFPDIQIGTLAEWKMPQGYVLGGRRVNCFELTACFFPR